VTRGDVDWSCGAPTLAVRYNVAMLAPSIEALAPLWERWEGA
jgi:hypothetical protein